MTALEPQEGVRLAPRSVMQVSGRLVALFALAAQLAVAARFLSPVDLGTFVAALAVLGIAGAFAEFGLTNTIVLSLSRGRAPRVVLSEAIKASGILCAFALLGAALASWFVLGDDLWAFFCLVPWFVVSRAGLPLIGFCQWQHRFSKIAAADAIGRMTATAFMFAGWRLGMGLNGSARLAVLSGALLTGSLVSFFILANIGVRPTKQGRPWSLIRDALPIGLTNGASYVHSRIDQVVLSLFGFRRALASYGVAYRVVDASLAAALGVATVALPVLGRATSDERADIGVMFGGLVGALAFVLGILVFWLASPIVLVLGGPHYRSAAPLLRLLSPVLVVSLLNMVPAHLALVHDRARALMRVAVGLLVVNVGVNLLLVPSHQARGAAVASIVTESLGLVCVSWIAARSMRGGAQVPTVLGTTGGFLLVTVGASYCGTVSPVLAAFAVCLGVSLGVSVLLGPLRLLLLDSARSRTSDAGTT